MPITLSSSSVRPRSKISHLVLLNKKPANSTEKSLLPLKPAPKKPPRPKLSLKLERKKKSAKKDLTPLPLKWLSITPSAAELKLLRLLEKPVEIPSLPLS